MTLEGWREAILKAGSDEVLLEFMSRLLAEQDAAKQRLRDLGFGVTGTPWPEIIDAIAVTDIVT